MCCSIQGADLMSKFGVNVPKGVVASSTSEIAKVLEEHFPDDAEVTRFFSFFFLLHPFIGFQGFRF